MPRLRRWLARLDDQRKDAKTLRIEAALLRRS
jgi:hypothetical protein